MEREQDLVKGAQLVSPGFKGVPWAVPDLAAAGRASIALYGKIIPCRLPGI